MSRINDYLRYPIYLLTRYSSEITDEDSLAEYDTELPRPPPVDAGLYDLVLSSLKEGDLEQAEIYADTMSRDEYYIQTSYTKIGKAYIEKYNPNISHLKETIEKATRIATTKITSSNDSNEIFCLAIYQYCQFNESTKAFQTAKKMHNTFRLMKPLAFLIISLFATSNGIKNSLDYFKRTSLAYQSS